MKGFEWARAGVDAAAAGLCRYCPFGLCPGHLAEAAVPQYPLPAYTCRHWTAVRTPGAQQPAPPG
jgi:hypothetical protein